MNIEEIRKNRTTITIAELKELLGVCRTESYYIAYKKEFDVIFVGGKLRIVIDSFMDWYSKQYLYKLKEGPPPGSAFPPAYYYHEVKEMLGLSAWSINYLVNLNKFKTFHNGIYTMIDKESFESWYSTQFHYKKVNGERPGGEHANTLSTVDVARLLGMDTDHAYQLCKKGYFKFYKIYGENRIDTEEFLKWYYSQNKYHFVEGEKIYG